MLTNNYWHINALFDPMSHALGTPGDEQTCFIMIDGISLLLFVYEICTVVRY